VAGLLLQVSSTEQIRYRVQIWAMMVFPFFGTIHQEKQWERSSVLWKTDSNRLLLRIVSQELTFLL
jgi:hypothetical protein